MGYVLPRKPRIVRVQGVPPDKRSLSLSLSLCRCLRPSPCPRAVPFKRTSPLKLAKTLTAFSEPLQASVARFNVIWDEVMSPLCFLPLCYRRPDGRESNTSFRTTDGQAALTRRMGSTVYPRIPLYGTGPREGRKGEQSCCVLFSEVQQHMFDG